MPRNQGRRAPRAQEVEATWGRPLAEILRELYIEQNLTIPEVADRLGVAWSTVLRWLRKAGITPRRWRIPPTASS
ncbi:MAG: DUF1804 family protein [Actinomycetia bacterium]|nr:DUF1804 family protein [Actinomycetes bacterium]